MTRQAKAERATGGGNGGETATQTLHRLTSYEPGREWDEPVDDPRVLQDLEVNDLARFPWFYKRYVQSLPRLPLPREPAAHDGPGRRRARGHRGASPAPSSTCRISPGCCTCRPGWCARWSGRTRRGCSAPPGPRAAVSPSSCTSPCPTAWRLPAGVHWYDPHDHALVQVGPPPRGARPPSSSPASRGAPGGATASAATGTSIGTPAPCSPSCSRWPTPRGSPRGCTAASPTRRSPRSSARTGCTSGPWPSSRSATARRRSTRPVRPLSGDVDAAPVEFPLVTSRAAGGGTRHARAAVGSRRAGRRARRSS